MLQHIERIFEARSIEALWSLHLARMAEFGFDRLLYGYTRFRTAASFGDLNDALLLSNHAPQYLDTFISKGMFQHAPMVRWAAENVGACSWSWIEAHAPGFTETERRIVAFNLSHGVRAGYSISFKDVSARFKGAIGLAAPRSVSQAEVDAIWERNGREILAINNITHLRITSLPNTSTRRSLTPRQREVLEWVGDGKSLQDIATIMGLTVATVDKHLKLAREALNVGTTTQAVLKASFQNRIFTLDA